MPNADPPDFRSNTIVLQHLRRHYYPSDEVSQSSRAVIDEYDESLALSDTEFAASMKTRQDIVKKLKNAQSLLAHIRMLPIEILGEIFYRVAYIPDMDALVKERQECRQRPISDYMPLVLQRVCRLWHDVTISTSKLYTQLFFPCMIFDDDNLPSPSILIPIWLQRSQTLPMEAYLYLKPDEYQSISSLLSRSISRMTRLSIAIDTLFLNSLFPPNTRTELPLLRNFSFLGFHENPDTVQMGVIVADSLVKFTTAFHDGWQRFIQFGNHLSHFNSSYGIMHISTLVKLLSTCPSLETVRVIYSEADYTDTIPPNIIDLPNLTKFSLKWGDETRGLRQIMQRLKTPNLRSLSMQAGPAGEEISLIPDISSWIQVSKVDLRRLSLGGVYYHPPTEELSTLLKLTPSLDEIWLSWALDEDDLALLNRYTNPHICPSLVKMTFDFAIVPIQAFLYMISSRAMDLTPVEPRIFFKKLETLVARKVYGMERADGMDLNQRGNAYEEINDAIAHMAHKHPGLRVNINGILHYIPLR